MPVMPLKTSPREPGRLPGSWFRAAGGLPKRSAEAWMRLARSLPILAGAPDQSSDLRVTVAFFILTGPCMETTACRVNEGRERPSAAGTSNFNLNKENSNEQSKDNGDRQCRTARRAGADCKGR